MRRTVSLLSVLLCLVAGGGVAGCGEEDRPSDQAGDALGAKTEADLERLDAFFKTARPFPQRNADFQRALQKEDIPGARKAQDTMTGILDEIDKQLLAFESPKVVDTLERYTRSLRRVIDAYERLLVYLEDETAEADKRLERELFRDIQTATRAAQAEDRRFVRQLTASLPADERDEFQERYREYLDDLREQAEP